MFTKVLVANRGAVAARIIRALRQMNIRSVAVCSEADATLPYLAQADEVYAIGPAPAMSSYLDQDRLLDVLARSKADAVHPGYGFLSENAAFARRVIEAGAAFIGPSPRWIEAMGHKTRARELMARHGMPMSPSSGLLDDHTESISAAARAIGYPVLIKPAAGGGGIGMVPARDEVSLLAAIAQARSVSQKSFGNGDLYLEKLIERPRHIEFQILADKAGNACHLFERDCSVQRRHQKVIEESPAPLLPRRDMEKTAERIAGLLQDMGYDVIGTAETLFGADGTCNFLEMNTRLQVEHAVTEAITGVDLVTSQIRLAAGEGLASVIPDAPRVNGHAIEVRVYAEDPVRFFPSPGKLETFELPQGEGIRVETGYMQGNTVTPYYDPMLAKIIVHAVDRAAAIRQMKEALLATQVRGVKTNIPFAVQVLDDELFQLGHIHTGLGTDILAAARH
ncbi:biotin carboxylase N-terminal domain-containing protein [Pandoraea pnomenusa]|uniref:acetyl-CoA carboxylase biotin carboxylase subunit n=1 Tax=Pandoraea pnomenusa TaxID=93220 RepID=UPI00334016FF